MRMEKSEALLLRRFRHGDTSLVVHAFTRDHGRIPFIAKGARSGGRKPPVPLVPVVLLELVWKPSTRSELQFLREWSLVDGLGELHKDYEKLAWAQAGLEVLAKTLRGEGSHERLFEQTLAYLQKLGQAGQRHENLFVAFRLQVLRELGFELNLAVPEQLGPRGRFQPARGALMVDDGRVTGTPISAGGWKSLGALARAGFEEASRIRFNNNALREINQVLDAAYAHAFEKWGPLESLKLLQIGNAGADNRGGAS